MGKLNFKICNVLTLRALLSIAAINFFASPILAIGPLGPTWKTPELIASGPNSYNTGDKYLAFDHYGQPAVANGPVFYQRQPGGAWGNTFMTPLAVGPSYSHSSLAFDRRELPTAVYKEDNTTTLRTYNTATNDWATQFKSTGNPSEIAGEPTLALDVYGQPVVAVETFNNASNQYYFNIFSDNGAVSSPTRSGPSPSFSLAVDSANRFHISYYNSSTTDYELFTHNGVVGTSQSIQASQHNQIGESSLAINPVSDQPAMAYVYDPFGNISSRELRYSEWNESTNLWDTVTVATGADIISPSLAFDPSDGRPAIAYSSSVGLPNGSPLSKLFLSYYDGAAWQNTTVPAGSAAGEFPSLAFREFGGQQVAGIAYYNQTGDLFYIEDPPAVPTPEPSTAVLLLTGMAGLLSRRRRGA